MTDSDCHRLIPHSIAPLQLLPFEAISTSMQFADPIQRHAALVERTAQALQTPRITDGTLPHPPAYRLHYVRDTVTAATVHQEPRVVG